MKMYIPKIGDLIRLTEDATIHEQRVPYIVPDKHAMFHIMCPGDPWDWHRAQTIDQITLVKGTVLKFKRLFVSAHAKTNAIEVSIFAHPDHRLTPRAQGGKAPSTITFTLNTEQVNLISYERVE